MEHRIYFSVCGEGYGHSSRCLAIAEELQASKAKVLMAGYGYVFERMKKNFDAVEVPREFEMAGKDGAFDIKSTIAKSAGPAFQASKISEKEEKLMKDFGATCVVADGRFAAISAAFRLGLPCIMVSNQTSIEPFFREAGFLRHVKKHIDFLYSSSATLSDEIIIPDFAPPYTVCLPTLSRYKHVMKREKFVGPVVGEAFMNAKRRKNPDVESPFILTILGGHAFRRPIFDGILEAAKGFPKMNFIIFTKFESPKVPKNVIVRKFADDISSYMKAAELIITQAGHSTAMEIMSLGKPALIIPDTGQTEQENNAARMNELGVAETLDYAHLAPKNMLEKISRLLGNEMYKKNAIKYSLMARKMNGAKIAAEIILEYSARVQRY